jgi:heat shock protein HtpX
MTTVMFLLGALFVALVVTLMYTFSNFAFIIAVGGIGIAFYQWWASDKVAMRAMRAREVTPEQAPELHGMIDRLCEMADMPKPRVAIADTNLPNAFATGRNPNHAAIAVTRGLWERLEPQEVEGVLAHELSHVANRDVLVMTLASFFAMLAGILSRWMMYAGMFGGGNRNSNDNNSVPVWLIVLAVSVITYFLSQLLILAISRYREFAADRGSALLTGAPEHLMSALQKIASDMLRIPQQDLREVEAMNAFFIIPTNIKQRAGSLFMTHPPLEQRLERLSAIAREMGRPVA